jgi:hypothetical protein
LTFYAGYLYVTDFANHNIRAINISTMQVTTLAGSSSGLQDGTGTNAKFHNPSQIAVDTSGWLWVADTYSYAIRKVAITTGQAITVLGGTFGNADGVGTNAKMKYTYGIAIDTAGNVLISDSSNVIRMLNDTTYNVTTIAGTVNTGGFADGIGTNAQFNGPYFLAIGTCGILHVADGTNQRIRYLNYL